jgi:WD40 repeat protein
VLVGYQSPRNSPQTHSESALWDLDLGAIKLTLDKGDGFINDVSLSRDARLAVTAFGTDMVAWELPAGRKLHTASVEVATRLFQLKGGGFGVPGQSKLQIYRVAILPDKKQALIAAGSDPTLKADLGLWDLDTGVLRTYPEAHQDKINALSVSADGQWALSAGKDKTLKLWKPAELKLVNTLTTGTEIAAAAIAPQGQQALTADDYLSSSTAIRVWDLTVGRSVGELEGHAKRATALVFLRDGQRALSASEDGTVRLWDVAARRELTRYHVRGVVRSLAVAASEEFFFTGDDRGWLCQWRLPTP